MATFVIYTYQFAPVMHPVEGMEYTCEERASINESLNRKQEILSSYLDEGSELEFRNGDTFKIDSLQQEKSEYIDGKM